MERIQPMNELQIQEKVEDLAGKSAKIVDYAQSTMNQMEEVLLVNGVSIPLTGEEGAKIKEALIHGEVPPCDLVNNMLIRAGIEKNPVELETTMNVKSCIKTLEHSTLLDSNGVLVDEKLREKEDEDEFKTVNVEIWNTEHSSMEKSEEIKQNIIEQPQIKTFTGNEEDMENISEDTKSNKKSLFSPISIIKSNKSDSKNKKKTQESTPQLDPVHVKVSSQPESPSSNMPSTETKNVSNKNKFLSLFSKGKSKDKNGKHSEGKSKEKNNSENKHSEGKSSKTKLKDGNILEENKKKSFTDKLKPDNNTLPKKETKKQNANVNYLDPSLSLVHVEIDGVPVRVTYETFV